MGLQAFKWPENKHSSIALLFVNHWRYKQTYVSLWPLASTNSIYWRLRVNIAKPTESPSWWFRLRRIIWPHDNNWGGVSRTAKRLDRKVLRCHTLKCLALWFCKVQSYILGWLVNARIAYTAKAPIGCWWLRGFTKTILFKSTIILITRITHATLNSIQYLTLKPVKYQISSKSVRDSVMRFKLRRLVLRLVS